ncbi:MAG TPA: tetratricopeptide repeat protein [Chlamydiales bacterium]|nr:tetratricopeptide repeat protein [Chlamydiales bacterium]
MFDASTCAHDLRASFPSTPWTLERAWEQPFLDGIAAFRSNGFEKALSFLNTVSRYSWKNHLKLELKIFQAISNGGQRYTIYDSRAATFEKLGRFKEALNDSRKVIELAPQQRHVRVSPFLWMSSNQK